MSGVWRPPAPGIIQVRRAEPHRRGHRPRLVDAATSDWEVEPVILWLLVLVLVILAVAGGVALSPLLWIVLVAALIAAFFAFNSGRTA